MAIQRSVPEGFKLYKENTAQILLPATDDAFLNPVQEFNRDTSVACISVWGTQYNQAKEKSWLKNKEKKARQAEKRLKEDNSAAPPDTPTEYQPHKFVVLEALSATGLRSIRYAQELPLVKYVIANDLSSDAIIAMKRNVDFNGLGSSDDAGTEAASRSHHHGMRKVRINEGDACSLMYSHREEKKRVDVVDLDPYGTAAPFVDAAIQCVHDGGLLCVTCTDLAVLATNNMPEKCFSNYGGIPLKAEYCHESSLRLVLHMLSTTASRYGRYIVPMLSLSIDFYVRVFVKVFSGPIEVKKAAINTSMYYVCAGCQSFYEQPLSRVIDKGNGNRIYKTSAAPSAPQSCPECDSALHLAGPMWSGPLHNAEFVTAVLQHVDENMDKYKTSPRMKGMLTVAKEELNTPFFFTPSRIASVFHCSCPPLDSIASALLHAGYEVSRSHACAGSLKTTAPRTVLHDIFRSWIEENPVKMGNIAENSPARRLLSKEAKIQADFSHHPNSITSSSAVRLVRYQQNPTPNWGPGVRASKKRKRDDGENS